MEIFTLDNLMPTSHSQTIQDESITINEDSPLLAQTSQMSAAPHYERPRHSVAWVMIWKHLIFEIHSYFSPFLLKGLSWPMG